MINFDGCDVRLKKIEEIKALNLPIFVWGGHTYGRVITDYLREDGVNSEVTYVVDDEYKKVDDGCMPLSQYLENHSQNSVMIFGFYNYKVIQKKKQEYGAQIRHLYDFHLTSLNNIRLKWDRGEAEARIPDFEKTYNMLADDKSKETMNRYLRAAINGEFDELYQNCHEDISYFNEVTKGAGIDTLVDCGAYDGDSIHDFINVFSDYKQIYAIEPDELNRKKLMERIEKESIHSVNIVPKGVYKESTILHFSAEGNPASHMDDRGDIDIPVIALDELLADCNSRILIKMDIEGSEMDALAGAARTISEKHPCLTICVYHKETDLVLIPQYIDDLVEEGTYDYFIRFHGLDLAELVFYAIPKK